MLAAISKRRTGCTLSGSSEPNTDLPRRPASHIHRPEDRGEHALEARRQESPWCAESAARTAPDRNLVAKILFLAEALDRRTRGKGMHGGIL